MVDENQRKRKTMSAKKKMMSEKETIQNILSLAREQGVEDKVKKLISRFQEAVKTARSQEERQSIATLGLAEIYKTIGCVGGLVVDGVEVIPSNPSYENEINQFKGLVKLD